MFISACIYGQTENEKQEIIAQYDLNAIQTMKQRFEIEKKQEKEEALKIAKLKGWDMATNNQDGTFMELQKVVDGKPIYYTTFNVNAARSTRTDYLNENGSLGLNLMGQNMTAYVWDGGATSITHREFDGNGGNNRVSIIDDSAINSVTFHAQHVTGTIVASGVDPLAKGMAPYARARTADWNDDFTEVSNEVINGMLLSNHSYGFNPNSIPDYFFGAYITESREWDEIMFNAPNYLMVVAAGNAGNNNTANGLPLNGNSLFDKLTGHATSKNGLVVANAQDANIDNNGNLISVFINSSSSEGPTDDLRIKPDITGNGTNVYSSFHFPSWDARTGQNLSDGFIDDDYLSITGTSMASPNVTGSLLLLQQHYNNLYGNFMRAATLKGLSLHTADDAGAIGPDAIFGWGLLNAKKAAETITSMGDESLVEELTLSSGETYTFNVTSDGINPLIASISWTDRPGTATTTANLTTPVLINDLDIRVNKSSTEFEPWRLTGITTNDQGDNAVDPFERVDILNASGEYTITVTHKGSLEGINQNYSLIITGISPCEDMVSIYENVTSGEFDSKSALRLLTANNTIATGGSAQYQAGERVMLTSGFSARSGSTLKASIGECGSSTSNASSKELINTEVVYESISAELTNFSVNEEILNIYPNPFKDTVNIQTNDAISTLQILSMEGKVMFKQTKISGEINTSKFPDGLYLVRVTTKTGEVLVKKMIKK